VRRRHPYLEAAPLAIAHRGGALDLPENTMPAFAAAVELGYRYLETDAHATRDGAVVAFHDEVLDRVTDRRGTIAALDSAEVLGADAAYAFSLDGGHSHPWRDRGVRIPLLSELLERWPHVRVNIDAKSDAVVEPLARLLLRMEVLDRVCVGSFKDRRLTRLRRLCGPRLCTSMGPRAITVARLASRGAWMPRLGADCLQVPVYQGRWRVVDAALVRAAHRRDLQVHVWTIDDAAEMDTLLDLGVDGLMTDRPAVLRAVLEKRGLWS